MGKIFQLPGAELKRIKEETTKAAEEINQVMIKLQDKFPDKIFKLEFQFQRVANKKYYRIHIKTFKDE